MSGILDFFRQQPQQPTAADSQQPNNGQPGQQQGQQPNNNGQQPNVQGPSTIPNDGGQPANNNNQNAGMQPEPKGIDRFSKLWDNPTTESNGPPSYSLDPKILNEVAGSQDFMQGINPELMAKAQAGDVKSMFEVMQAMSRSVYARSLEHGGTLTDKFVGAREAHSSKNLGKSVRSELTTTALSAIPNFKNRVIQKQLKDTAERMQQMYPDAGPQEIANMAIEYYKELVDAIQPADTKAASKGKEAANTPVNWDKWFAEEQQQGNE